MYTSYRDVLKRSERFTPDGRPVWPLSIHGPAQSNLTDLTPANDKLNKLGDNR